MTSAGIRDREKKVTEIVARELRRGNPDKWGFVQDHEIWSTKEETRMSPGHNGMLKFGRVSSSMSCVDEKFKLIDHKWEEYKGLCFYDGDCDHVLEL